MISACIVDLFQVANVDGRGSLNRDEASDVDHETAWTWNFDIPLQGQFTKQWETLHGLL